jgi:hypothetical protein
MTHLLTPAEVRRQLDVSRQALAAVGYRRPPIGLAWRAAKALVFCATVALLVLAYLWVDRLIH